MSILQNEKTTYEEMWAVPGYDRHSPGEMYLPLFLQIVGERRGTVLDAGCGSGKGAVALAAAGFDVSMYDVTDSGLVEAAKQFPFAQGSLWNELAWVFQQDARFFDYVYCTDVLEHVPPQFTMLCIDQMLRVAVEGLFLSVSLVPDSFGVWAGKPLHQTVRDFTWWRDSLREVGNVLEARDLINNGVFFLEER